MAASGIVYATLPDVTDAPPTATAAPPPAPGIIRRIQNAVLGRASADNRAPIRGRNTGGTTMKSGIISGWRIVSLFCVFTLMTSAIGWRLVSFQIVGSERLQSQGRDFRITEQTLLPRRGLIRDRGGLVLATNIPSTDIYVTPKTLTDRDRVHVAQELSAILNIPLDTLYERINAPKCRMVARRAAGR